MSAKLKLLERKFARDNPERIPAPAEDDLSAAIQRLVDQRVEQALEERPVKQPAHVQRLMDDFNRPKPVTDYRDLPPVQKAPKTPPPFESVVSQRDALGRIAKMTTKPLQGNGPTFETAIMQRDELGRIVRAVTSVVDALPSTPR